MRETTAAAELKDAWDAITRTAWRSAAEALDKAAAIDPADARVAAFRSVLDANRDGADPAAAQRDRRSAMALEESRARLLGTTFGGNTALDAAIDLLDPQAAGLSLLLRVRLGNAYLAARDNQRAIDAFAADLALEKRLDKRHLIDLLPSAMLPDPALEAQTVPEAPTLASLLADARLGTARAMLALGRPADAAEQYRRVRAYLATWPITATGRETLYAVDAWARLGEAEAAVAARDYDTAFTLLMAGEGWPGKLPPELEKRRKELSDQVVAARQRRPGPVGRRNAHDPTATAGPCPARRFSNSSNSATASPRPPRTPSSRRRRSRRWRSRRRNWTR